MTFDPPTLDEVAAALAHIDCNNRDKWVNAANAIKSEFGIGGQDTWLEWSKRYEKYRQADALAVWKSCQSGKVPIGWIFKEAIARGYVKRRTERSEAEKKQAQKEYAIRQEKIKAQQIEDDKHFAALQDRVAEVANQIWNNVKPVDPEQSEYLKRKKVGAHGLRVVHYGVIVKTDTLAGTVELIRGSDNIKAFYKTNPFSDKPEHISIHHYKQHSLVVPMRNSDGVLRSLQFITPNGTKMFMKRGQKKGTYYFIGEHSPRAPLCLAEGFATAASTFEATGWAVAITWDKGNLKTVAQIMRELFKEADILICGDDDVDTDGNPGRKAAIDAAGLVNGKVVFPAFLEAS